MAGFNVEEFLGKEGLSIQDLKLLKKENLRAICDYFELSVAKSARKDELVQAISQHLNLTEVPKVVQGLSSKDLLNWKN